ncbi:SIS domain-containing protein [Paenibacillus sp.]|uniref:SIS domain-containing protein n=1 Tax=Paenibacillus sp. TaxID=58172 RepID=UPI002D3C1063|nr:SIS domain-containing protein [Paenibacillus sp.]HZG55046.1 SIS domain-containing protein [Paenibacillus sp.]
MTGAPKPSGTAVDRYFEEVRALLARAQAEQRTAMEETAALFARTVQRGGTLFVTGCSHSSIFAQEVFYRAGGFLLMNPLFLPGMTLEKPPVTLTTRFERLSGLAEAVLEESPVRPGDVLVIASVSGRNAVPIEMALWAKARGVAVVALTSVPYSERVESRHAGGKRLFELADYTLDLLCPPGDAVLAIDGLSEKTGPASTVVGVAMLHAVVARTLELLIEAGVEPPVFVSANIDGAEETNRRRLEAYGSRIHYL